MLLSLTLSSIKHDFPLEFCLSFNKTKLFYLCVSRCRHTQNLFLSLVVTMFLVYVCVHTQAYHANNSLMEKLSHQVNSVSFISIQFTSFPMEESPFTCLFLSCIRWKNETIPGRSPLTSYLFYIQVSVPFYGYLFTYLFIYTKSCSITWHNLECVSNTS